MTHSPLAILAMPKPFLGHIGMIQRNAIQSWIHLTPRPEIFLCGEEDGTSEIAAELNLSRLQNIALNDSGTPLLNGVFHRARQSTNSPLLCYVNCDIILLQAFADAVSTLRANLPKFLAVAHRWEIDLTHPLEFDHAYQLQLDQFPSGFPGHHTAIDVFVFTRDMYLEVPPLAIGRAWFDQWLIKDAIAHDLPVVDITKVARAIHQKHDYAHIAGGQRGAYAGEEAQRNLEIYGSIPHAFTLLNATHELLLTGEIRPVRFRPQKFRMQQWAWRNFIQRTAPLRKKLGLSRTPQREPSR
jgi:hypothetical protein